MSIRWIRNILVNGKKTTVEVLLGTREISDKCYVRIDNGPEHWFSPKGETRDDVLQQGINYLRTEFDGKKVETPTGDPYSWN